MQIEFIGCTSAGKSTLIEHLLHAYHEQGVDILPGNDFILKQVRLNWIKNHQLRMFLVNLAGLCACLATWRKNLEFHLFATRLLYQLPISPFVKLYLFRNVLKRIGIYEIIRFRSTDQQIILVDEGTLQTAHNLFVHGSATMKMEDLSTFAGLIPIPDSIVYLRQPESLLIDRIMKRGHKRIPDRSYSNVAHFVKQAVATFDGLVQYPKIEKRVLAVNGSQEVMTAINSPDNPIMGLISKINRDNVCLVK